MILRADLVLFLAFHTFSNFKISNYNIMNVISYKIGYWSAILMAISFVIWLVSFVGIALTSPLFYWTGVSDYISHIQATESHFFQNLAYLFMLLLGPLYVMLINAYYEYAEDTKKFLVRIALMFGLAFAILSSYNYFVQLSAVRLNILHENFDGIQHFTQANPNSIMTASVMLGWSLFLGLSSLFIFPVFREEKPGKLLKYTFMFNAFSCLMAGIGYVFQIDAMTFLFTNLGTGGALLIISLASIKMFKAKSPS